ncbi:MAG: extracellular solute-binding protein, partial [Ardenticatenaceae bacterium]
YIEASGINPEERWFPIARARAVYDGRFYGVPRDVTAGFIAYNKDIFDAAGVPYPEPGWTIADFREKALQLTDVGSDQYGVGAIVGGPGCFQWSSFSFNMGAEFVSPDGRQVAGYLDTPEAINALEWCLNLIAEDQVTAPVALQEQFGELVLLSGKVAMDHVSTWELPALREQSDFEWGVVEPPRFSQESEGISWTDSYVLYMWSGSPRKQRTWEFLEWLSGPEAGRMMAEAGVWTPALPAVWQELGWPEDPILGVVWDELTQEARTPNYLRSQFYDACVGPVFNNLISRYVELGERDLEAMVAEEVATAQTCLDDNYASLPES